MTEFEEQLSSKTKKDLKVDSSHMVRRTVDKDGKKKVSLAIICYSVAILMMLFTCMCTYTCIARHCTEDWRPCSEDLGCLHA